MAVKSIVKSVLNIFNIGLENPLNSIDVLGALHAVSWNYADPHNVAKLAFS